LLSEQLDDLHFEKFRQEILQEISKITKKEPGL
jgi:hypothetical protein